MGNLIVPKKKDPRMVALKHIEENLDKFRDAIHIPDQKGRLYPGENYKNKVDCFISSHQFVKAFRDYEKFRAEIRYERLRILAERRSEMHAERNAKRARRKQLYAGRE